MKLEETKDQITKEIDRLLPAPLPDPILIAIDGPCASGKTTLADLLSKRYDCNVFHMDDFFLQPHQRTEARLSEIGGNVDYERFQKEVLQPLAQGIGFSYRVYDCGSRTMSRTVTVEPKRLNIIEGSYSRHPYFGSCYHLKYCLSVDPVVQKERILKRNGADMWERFEREWIPMENAYLKLL